MDKNNPIDISDLTFVYENVVSFVNSICLDIDVLNKLYSLNENGKVSEDKKDLFGFLLRRTFLSLVITFDTVIDDTNADRDASARVANKGINVDKLLCSIQNTFINEKDEKKLAELNKSYDYLKAEYDKMQKLNERKQLKTFRDKLAAHLDKQFIKKEEYNNLNFSVRSAAVLMDHLIKILRYVRAMISCNQKLIDLKPIDPNRKTPIDSLFGE